LLDDGRLRIQEPKNIRILRIRVSNSDRNYPQHCPRHSIIWGTADIAAITKVEKKDLEGCEIGAVKRPSKLSGKDVQILIANVDGWARIHIRNADAESFR
jgi:hypothetical protein